MSSWFCIDLTVKPIHLHATFKYSWELTGKDSPDYCAYCSLCGYIICIVCVSQNIVMARVTRGFDRADSTNLPYVDTFMMLDFMKGKTEFVASKMKGAETEW